MTKLSEMAKQLKEAAHELLAELNSIDAQIEVLHKQRDAVTSGHVSKADYLRYLATHFEIKGARFKTSLLREIEAKGTFDFGNLERGLLNKNGFIGLNFLTVYSVPVPITDDALYFYFNDVLIDKISQALDAHAWPNDAMPAEACREALLSIEQAIKELEQSRNALVKSIDDAGINR